MNFNRFITDALARLHALELRLVLIVKAHLFENRNQVGLVVTPAGKINIMSVPLSACKSAHGQTADKAWLNAKVTS